MPKISFTVLGPPVPKERARVVHRTDSAGKTTTRGITPKRTREYEEHVGNIARYALMSHNGGRRELFPCVLPETRYGLRVEVHYSGKGGDGDNYFKAIADACNRILWPDDRQIDEGTWVKRKVEPGAERVIVEAWILEP